MNGRSSILCGGLLGLPVAALPACAAAETPTAQDIVAAADRVRNPGQPFRLTDTLVEYVKGKPRDRTVLVIYACEDRETPQFSNLVRYAEPPRDAG
jgi:hypothetical protein